MKYCPCCKTTKRSDAFYKDASRFAKNKLNGNCKSCRLEAQKKYRKKNRARLVAYSKKYYSLNFSKFKAAALMSCYGITIENFVELIKRQNGCCAICGRHHTKCPKGKGKPNKIRLYIDHDHSTGVVRGLLCHNCNARLDHLATPELLIKSAEYLNKHKQQRKEG